MEAEKSHNLKDLQAGDSEKQVSLSPNSKAELMSEEPLSEGLSFTQISQFAFLLIFHCIQAFNRLDDATHTGEDGSLYSLIQGNALTDPPRNKVLPVPWASLWPS